jgi:hypothetical protein
MAAAGLWTTPSDLMRFALGVQQARAGTANPVISQAMARQMLTNQKDNDGLGVFLDGSGHTLRFSHNGRDEGFDALMMAYAETGQGVAIMINTNDNTRMMSRILEAVAREYRWPGFPLSTPPARQAAKIDENTLVACTGRYEAANNQMLVFTVEKGRLVTLVDGFPDEAFLPESADRFFSADRDAQITFVKDDRGEVSGYLWKEGGQERKAPRIGPLMHSLKPQADPDPARTQNVEAALRAFAQGGDASVASPLITPGAHADFGSRPVPEFAGLQSLVFLTDRDVSGRQIERHNGKVSHILHYKLVTDRASRYVLVYLTADGLVTDFDVVDD